MHLDKNSDIVNSQTSKAPSSALSNNSQRMKLGSKPSDLSIKMSSGVDNQHIFKESVDSSDSETPRQMRKLSADNEDVR